MTQNDNVIDSPAGNQNEVPTAVVARTTTINIIHYIRFGFPILVLFASFRFFTIETIQTNRILSKPSSNYYRNHELNSIVDYENNAVTTTTITSTTGTNSTIDIQIITKQGHHQMLSDDDDNDDTPEISRTTQEMNEEQITIANTYNNTQIAIRPPLNTLLDMENKTIIGDVSFLLDFAVMGFAKCGTSTMMHWLGSYTSEIQSFRKEVSQLLIQRPYNLVDMLYNQLPPDTDTVQYRRGYKAPSEIAHPHVLDYFRVIFTKTKIIVGIRHPVLWFESMYNFRVQNLGLHGTKRLKTMPPPSKLIGRCMLGMLNCCTFYSNFAHSLIRLGKQYINEDDNLPIPIDQRRQPTELENKIVGQYRRERYNISEVEPVLNPVFLFELSQLSDRNTTRADEFRTDVQSLLGLKSSLPDMIHFKPGQYIHNDTTQNEIDKRKIDICDDEYKPVRDALMVYARDTSTWIRTVFLNSPTVYYSSREYMDEILLSWMIDPCSVDKPSSSTTLPPPLTRATIYKMEDMQRTSA